MKRIVVVTLCLAFLGSYAEAQDAANAVNGWSLKGIIGDQSAVTRTRIASDTSANGYYVAGGGDYIVSGTKSQAFFFSLPPNTSVEWEKDFGKEFTTPPALGYLIQMNRFGIDSLQSVFFDIYLRSGETLFKVPGGLASWWELNYWWDYGTNTATYGTPPQTFSGIVVRFYFNPPTASGFAELLFDDLRLMYPNPLAEDSVVIIDRFGDPEPAPVPSVSPPAIDFGNVAVGSQKTSAVWVKNEGTAALMINAVQSSNAAFVATPATTTVQPGDSGKVEVTFQPKAQGVTNGNVTVVCNAGTQTVETSGTGVPLTDIAEESRNLPVQFKLRQNYPNPFNSTTTIEFSLPARQFVNLTVYNASGQEVAALVSEMLSEGTHRTEWNAGKYPSGIYWYKMNAETFTETKRMLLIK